MEQAEDYGAVKVIVRGDGRHEQKNVYKLSASKLLQ